MRGFLVTVTKILRTSITNISNEVITLMISLMMGFYFTSSILLMRMNLPIKYRQAITSVLGHLEFQFYHQWFDIIFLASGCISAGILFILHLFRKSQISDTSIGDKYR